MVVEKLEDTLNGGYNGLYHEVAIADCYKLREINFVPLAILDIGANVGCFARFARELFPHALIVCIEPDPENFAHLIKFTDHSNMVFINKAIGLGKIHKYSNVENGAHETYFSKGVGFGADEIDDYEATVIEPIMVDEILFKYGRQKTILKCDCEGGENFIFTHKSSMDAFKQVDYLVMELHWAMSKYDHDTMKRVVKPTVTALLELSHTHHCTFEGDYFFAIKK